MTPLVVNVASYTRRSHLRRCSVTMSMYGLICIKYVRFHNKEPHKLILAIIGLQAQSLIGFNLS